MLFCLEKQEWSMQQLLLQATATAFLEGLKKIPECEAFDGLQDSDQGMEFGNPRFRSTQRHSCGLFIERELEKFWSLPLVVSGELHFNCLSAVHVIHNGVTQYHSEPGPKYNLVNGSVGRTKLL